MFLRILRRASVLLFSTLLFVCRIPLSRAEADRIAIEGVCSAALVDGRNGVVLWSSSGAEMLPVAGVSKLPALLTLAQAFDAGFVREDQTVRVSERAASIGGPTAFLEAGEELPASELMKAGVMISAGDAIVALGESVYGSESVFLDNIRVTLRQLDIDLTVSDVLGTGQLYSAEMLGKLGSFAAKSPTFTRYAGRYLEHLTHADGRDTELVNANRLVHSYAGCTGLLTGSSPNDGYSGVFAATKSDTTFVAVVIGAENTTKRFEAATELLNYGFANYRLETMAQAGTVIVQAVPVEGGDVRSVDLVTHDSVTLLLPRSDEQPTIQTEIPSLLVAPLSEDQSIGSVRYLDPQGNTIARVKLYPSQSVVSYRLFDILHSIATVFVGA